MKQKNTFSTGSPFERKKCFATLRRSEFIGSDVSSRELNCETRKEHERVAHYGNIDPDDGCHDLVYGRLLNDPSR